MSTRVFGHHHSWHSPAVGRRMHVRWFGRGGARLIAFPTSMGDHDEWPNRYMPDVLREQIERGWLQLWCVDTNQDASWYDKGIHPRQRAWRHLRYDAYLKDELLPFVWHVNGTPFTITTGASFGAFQAMAFALRHPQLVQRVIGMSGMYDVSGMTGGYSDDLVHVCNPASFIRHEWEGWRLDALRRMDIIIAVGEGDPNIAENREFSGVLWEKGIGNALRVWSGWSHDWPYWERMIVKYVSGHD